MNGTIAGSARKGSRRSSFTLIELLVVVAIILILAAITLKTMSMVTRKTATANTLKILQQVKAGLGMFYGMEGCYPPISGDTTYTDVVPPDMPSHYPSGTGWKQTTGLVWYLCYDSPDCAKWAKYMQGLPNGSSMCLSNVFTFQGNQHGVFTNQSQWFQDGWGNKLRYSADTNGYQKFALWSCGPNGNDDGGGGDDIGVTSQD